MALAIIINSKYPPDKISHNDTFLVISWILILIGLVLGAFALASNKFPEKKCTYRTIIAGIAVLLSFLLATYYTNMNMLRADGFSKVGARYSKDAGDYLRLFGDLRAAYKTRMDAIPFFQKALKFSPNQRAYLNDCGQNFLELARYGHYDIQMRQRNDQVIKPPTIDEIINSDITLYNNLSPRDFTLYSLACTYRAYQLDPQNVKRLLALVSVNVFWGGYLDKNTDLLNYSMELCRQAEKLSPGNPKIQEETKNILELMTKIKK